MPNQALKSNACHDGHSRGDSSHFSSPRQLDAEANISTEEQVDELSPKIENTQTPNLMDDNKSWKIL